MNQQKHRSIALAAALAAAAITLVPQGATAQTGFAPPALIDYQGIVYDSAGDPLSPGAAENFEMKFRVYDEEEIGILLWAESQIVTVSNGAFSVRIGEGSPIPIDGANNEPRGPLPQAFQGPNRYLGVTVVIPGETEGEIRPRLRFLSSPYSFTATRAAVADLVSSSTGSSTLFDATVINNLTATNLGVGGQPSASAKLRVTAGGAQESNGSSTGAIIINQAGVNLILDGDEIDSSGTLSINTNGVKNTQIGSGGFFTVNNNSGVGINHNWPDVTLNIRQAAGDSHPFRVENESGGILFQLARNGQSIINSRLDVNGVSGDTARFRNTTIGGNTSHVHNGANGDWYIRSSNGSGRVVIQDTGGNVGVGTSNTTARLTVSGADNNGTTAAVHINSGMLIDGNEIDTTQGILYLNSNREGEVRVGDGAGEFSVNTGNFSDSTVVIRASSEGDRHKFPLVVQKEDGNNLFQLQQIGNGFSLVLFQDNALKPGGGSWASLSDRRLKKGIREFQPGLDAVRRLRTVNFRYRDGARPGLTSKAEHCGFVAQEVAEVLPEAVSDIGDGTLALNPDAIYLAGINAIKELDTKVRSRDARLAQLQAENAALKARLDRLERLIMETAKGDGE